MISITRKYAGKVFLILILMQLAIISNKTLKVAPTSNDVPEIYFENTGYNRNIFNLPTSGQAAITPWSGSYWPSAQGGIAMRYGAKYPSYSQSTDHKKRYGQAGFSQYVSDNYSAAEKYDLLLGDYSYTLTNKSLAKIGRAHSWEGICHGWSPASFLEPRPVRSVTLTAADGVSQITFLPDDIKGLISQWYASSLNLYKTNFVGALCPNYIKNLRNIYTDDKCGSNNPATFVTILANQIGIRHMNLLFDNQADPEKWNFPAYKYTLTYWNPLTNANTSSINDAFITIAQARGANDSFIRSAANMAAKGTEYITGVSISITYTKEVDPRRSVTPFNDQYGTENYRALLELDGNHNIIGGIWTSNVHPDYIWKVGSAIKLMPEDNVTSFSGTSAELRRMTGTAKALSAKGQVIHSVVKFLVNNAS